MSGSASNHHIPVRTCVGCRKALPQAGLVRFVRDKSGVWTGDQASAPRQSGRGTYLCSSECAQRAAKNRRYPGLSTAALEYGLIVASVHHERSKD